MKSSELRKVGQQCPSHEDCLWRPSSIRHSPGICSTWVPWGVEEKQKARTATQNSPFGQNAALGPSHTEFHGEDPLEGLEEGYWENGGIFVVTGWFQRANLSGPGGPSPRWRPIPKMAAQQVDSAAGWTDLFITLNSWSPNPFAI